tara:strand:- start:329 stop:502 length:174 start_codon:yes stop_codon:yes gene_type:complete
MFAEVDEYRINIDEYSLENLHKGMDNCEVNFNEEDVVKVKAILDILEIPDIINIRPI